MIISVEEYYSGIKSSVVIDDGAKIQDIIRSFTGCMITAGFDYETIITGMNDYLDETATIGGQE